MLMIRMQRTGRKNDPSFRIVVVDSRRSTKSGSFLEVVGSYVPKLHRRELNAERIKHWLQHGAQASDTVHNMLVDEKIIEGKKINVLPRKSPIKKEVEGAEAPAAAAPAEAAPAEEPKAEEPAAQEPKADEPQA